MKPGCLGQDGPDHGCLSLFCSHNGASQSGLKHATFRHLHSIHEVGKAWPKIENVRVMYNEYDSDMMLDEGLEQLVEYPSAKKRRMKVELELNGANLLLPIQVNYIRSSCQVKTDIQSIDDR